MRKEDGSVTLRYGEEEDSEFVGDERNSTFSIASANMRFTHVADKSISARDACFTATSARCPR